MADILQVTYSKAIFLKEWFLILIEILWMFVPKGAVVNKSALVQLQALCWIVSKSVPKPTMTLFSDA